MIQRAFTTKRTRPLLMALAVTLIVLVALAVGTLGAAPIAAPLAAPTPGVNYELGNFCVDDYQPGSVCTANDVQIATITPTIDEACMGAGDTAAVHFTVQLLTNATTRYDIGMFVATDGGSAQTGNLCYHDFLQPASVAGPWNLTSGTGPFKEFDPDTCADTLQNDGSNYYTFQTEVTVSCVDLNGDGVVDPFSTCTSWDNNSGVNCPNVKGAYPSTNSKCRCELRSPGLLIYRGYDWGDLPDGYKTLTASDGARHAIQDSNTDNVPNTQGGIAAVWLGSTVDFSPWAETDGLPGAPAATGDDNNTTDDENGVTVAGTPWAWGTNGGQVSVNVNSSDGTCTGCQLGFWIDWNDDGDFADSGETFLKPVVYGTQTVNFDIPTEALLTNIYARFRLYAGNYVGAYQSFGLVVNGEVEDYYFALPTAVDLLSFTATGGKATILKWETASEVDNLGFNLYTAVQIDGPRTKLNEDLIPSLVAPGSPFGANYTYTDPDLKLPGTYYYWLEDVDIYGMTGLHGPVEVTVGKWQRAGWPLAD